MGSVHTGTRFISTAYPAPRSTQAINCATTTKQQGAPITGSGTATTFTTPVAPSRPAIRLRGGAVYDSVSGSRGYDVPYVYWVTHAALGTGPGTVFPGGGPGRTYISRGGTGRVSGFAGIYPRPGGPQFGGTMRLLGQARATRLNSSTIRHQRRHASVPRSDWTLRAGRRERSRLRLLGLRRGPRPHPTLVRPSRPINGPGRTATATGRTTRRGMPLTGTTMVYVDAFPWTTGLAVVSGIRGAYPDNHRKERLTTTAHRWVSGTIQLVSPHLVNWIGVTCPFSGCTPRSETTAGIAILRLQFVPEPSGWLLLAAGVGALVALRRASRRG